MTTAILVLLALYTFYISSPVLIPLTLAVLVTMLLAPVMSVFDSFRFPRPLSAAIVLAILGIGFMVSGLKRKADRERDHVHPSV